MALKILTLLLTLSSVVILNCQVQYNINSTVNNNIDRIDVSGNTFFHFHAAAPQNITDIVNDVFKNGTPGTASISGRRVNLDAPQGTVNSGSVPLIRDHPNSILSTNRIDNEQDVKWQDKRSNIQSSSLHNTTRYENDQGTSQNGRPKSHMQKANISLINTNHLAISDGTREKMESMLSRVLQECFLDKNNHGYFKGQTNYITTQSKRIHALHGNDLSDLQEEVYLILILKYLNDEATRYNFNDQCLINAITNFNTQTIKEMSMKVKDIMHKPSSRVRRNADESSYLESIMKKSEAGMIKELTDSGLILKTQQDVKRTIVIENSTVDIASFTYIPTVKDLPIKISFHPLLDWPEALSEKLLSLRPLGMNGLSTSYLRAMKISMFMKKCTKLLTWKEKRIANINLVNFLNIEDGKFCLTNAYCEGKLMRNYTCRIDSIRREKTKVLTNFEQQGFTDNPHKMEKIKLAFDRDLKTYDMIDTIDDITVCSIKDIYYNEKCNATSSYFGIVNVYFLDNGKAVISPLIEKDLKLHFNSSDMDFYECTSQLCFPKGEENCSGDINYCSKIAKCKPGSFGKCKVSQNLLGYKMKRGNGTVLYKLSYWTDMTFLVDIKSIKMVVTEDFLRDRHCNVDIKCDTLKLYINSSCVMRKAIINTGNHDSFFNLLNKTEAEINLSYNTIPHGLTTTVTIFDDLGRIYNGELKCEDINVCQTINCSFCKTNIINPQCMSNTFKIVITLTCLLTITFLAALIYALVFKGSKMGKKALVGSGRSIIQSVKKVKSALRNSVTKAKNAIMDEGNTNKDQQLQTISTESNQSNPKFHVIKLRPRARNANLFMIFIFLGLNFNLIRGCVDSTTLTTTQNDCTISTNGKMTCLIKSSVRISGAPIGQESCININGKNGEIISYISITTEAINYECKKNYLYHTGAVSIVGDTKPFCPGTEHCESWEQCTKFMNDTSFQKLLFPSTINVLSKFDCSTPNRVCL